MHVIVLVTCPDDRTAERIADVILKGRLAACVSMIGGIRSRYWWKGRIEDAEECLLLIKTRKPLVEKVGKAVSDNHPCDVPEVMAIPVVDGSREYLSWLESEATGTGTSP
ncbi:MAG: divalent-cation tolerance protein CutA [Candidatus Aenigmarchaeota archaeon]|nr:divalent-cation tolerance protein CutA [Candidatus Aenigmarchaeota archaeon]